MSNEAVKYNCYLRLDCLKNAAPVILIRRWHWSAIKSIHKLVTDDLPDEQVESKVIATPKAKCGELVLTREYGPTGGACGDGTTLALWMHFNKGTVGDGRLIVYTPPGGDNNYVLKVTMKDAQIKLVDPEYDSGSKLTREHFTLVFKDITFDYKMHDRKGEVIDGNDVTWSVEE